MQALREQVQNLQFEVDVLKGDPHSTKKDPGIDLTVLKSRERRDNPKFCVNAKSGANRAKFIMGGKR